MKMRTWFLAGASLLAMTAHASAEPISAALAFIAVGFQVSVTTGIVAIFSVLSPFLSAGLSLGLAAIGALAGRQKPDTRAIKNISHGGESAGRHAFGRVEIDAQIIFGNTAGYFISRWLAHCFGPLSAIETHYYDGREITVEADGYVSSPPWARLPTDPRPSYMNVQTKVGDGTETAWTSLMSDFPSTITSDHRARGITASLMRIENPGVASAKFPKLLQGGVKSLRLLARQGEFYDPRDASTEWSINGVLHILHYMRRLGGLPDSRIDFADIGDTADDAEVMVDTLTGTAVRCQLSGGWEGPITTDIVEDMMESAGIEEYTTAAGLTSLRFIEDWPEPEITFLARHILENRPQAGPESGRRPNICKLTYFSPERRYEKAEIDLTGAEWARIQNEIDAYGDQEMSIDLTFCCNVSQAQRIARRLFHMARADFGLLKTNFSGIAKWGKRTGLIEIPDVGEDGASVLVRVRFGTARPNDAEGTVEIPYQIIPDILSVPWDPDVDEVAAPPILLPQIAESSLTTPSIPTQAIQVQYYGGAYEIRLAHSIPGGGTSVEAVYRKYTGGLPGSNQSMTEVTGPPRHATKAANETGSHLDFRVRIFDADGNASHWSPTLDVPSLAQDNTPCATIITNAARVIVEGFAFDVITFQVPELRAVRWVTYSFSDDVHPGTTYQVAFPALAENPPATNVSVYVYTSNGTISV